MTDNDLLSVFGVFQPLMHSSVHGSFKIRSQFAYLNIFDRCRNKILWLLDMTVNNRLSANRCTDSRCVKISTTEIALVEAEATPSRR